MNKYEINMKFYREQMNMTQQELADRLGTNVRNIRRWENGESSPDVVTGILISRILRAEINDIFIVF